MASSGYRRLRSKRQWLSKIFLPITSQTRSRFFLLTDQRINMRDCSDSFSLHFE